MFLGGCRSRRTASYLLMRALDIEQPEYLELRPTQKAFHHRSDSPSQAEG
jgi:hypothetical protein